MGQKKRGPTRANEASADHRDALNRIRGGHQRQVNNQESQLNLRDGRDGRPPLDESVPRVLKSVAKRGPKLAAGPPHLAKLAVSR